MNWFRYVVADVFTDTPLEGNQVAVFTDARELPEDKLQQIAREMNLSETAFVVPRAGAGEDFELRWFTPTVEVDLCGHATLASAHVLWETGQVDTAATARFHTRSGLLTAARRGDWIELDFPATPDEAIDPPAGLIEAVGAKPRYVGRSRFDFLFELDDALARLDHGDAHMFDPAPAIEPLAPAAARSRFKREPRRVAGISMFLGPPRADLRERGERLRRRDRHVDGMAKLEAVAVSADHGGAGRRGDQRGGYQKDCAHGILRSLFATGVGRSCGRG